MGKMKKPRPLESSFLVDGKYLYEMVGDPESEVLAYVRYDRLTGEKELVDIAEKDYVEYMPPQNNLPFTGTILLPTYPEPYGSFTDLLGSIRDFINLYLELPANYLLIASYYVMLSWVFDGFEAIPYLRARGEYGTGKSRFLKVVGSLCYRPCFAGGSSTVSPIFRLIEMYKGLTLILDEADFRFSGPDSEIVKVLNCGYMKGMPVLRTEGEKVRVPTAYNTFGPKLIATRKEFTDLALESRCLTNYMTPMTRKDIPLHLPKGFERLARDIRNQLLMFRLEHYGSYEIDENLGMKGVEPRINQVLLPMFAIAQDEESREELREFALAHAKSQVSSRGETIEAEVLQAVVELSQTAQFIPVKEIVQMINKGRDKEQGEYMVSPHKVGRVNKTSFGFDTRRVKGMTEILWNHELGRSLCERYGVALPEGDPEVEFVEDLFGGKLSAPDKDKPDKEVSDG